MSLLEVRGLTAGYLGTPVIRDVSLSVDRGEIAAVIGPNGAGKSTMMRAIVGAIRSSSGTVVLDGQDLSGTSVVERVKRGLSLVPENRGIFPIQSVRDNLLVGAHTRRDRRAIDDDLAMVFELFPILETRAELKAGHLSGGEQQMLAVGIALMAKPVVMLLDEPSLGLAPKVVELIFDTLLQLKNDLVLVVVEQMVESVLAVADTAHLLELGRIAVSAPASELLTDPRVAESYLGGRKA